MSNTFIDLLHDVVNGAARQTGSLAPEWEAWAAECDTALRNGAEAVHEDTVTSAAEGYVAEWSTQLYSVPAGVQQLSGNTVSASNAVGNADADSTSLLGVAANATTSDASNLVRPINS
jgi:hypothetical protein